MLGLLGMPWVPLPPLLLRPDNLAASKVEVLHLGFQEVVNKKTAEVVGVTVDVVLVWL